MLALSCAKKKHCQQSDKLAGHVGEGLHLYSVGLYLTTQNTMQIKRTLYIAHGGLLFLA